MSRINWSQGVLEVSDLADLPRDRVFPNLIPNEPFDPKVLDFVDDLSNRLLRDLSIRSSWPDAAAFGYFLRKTNIRRAQRHYEALADLGPCVRVPVGNVLQFAPSNVEMIGFYCWSIALLCGNPTITRISSRKTAMTDVVVEAIAKAAESTTVAPNWTFIEFPHAASEIAEFLSKQADLVVIWGGNESVEQLRALPSSASARSLPFPDRESLAVISAKSFLELSPSRQEQLAALLLRDITLFSQNACSSPRLVIWIGIDAAVEAERRLLAIWSQKAEIERRFSASEISDRRVSIFRLVAEATERMRVVEAGPLTVISDVVRRDVVYPHSGRGIIATSAIATLDDLERLLMPSDQTLVHFGIDESELLQFTRGLKRARPLRFVPVGESATFDFYWDGYDLISELTRAISVGIRSK